MCLINLELSNCIFMLFQWVGKPVMAVCTSIGAFKQELLPANSEYFTVAIYQNANKYRLKKQWE